MLNQGMKGNRGQEKPLGGMKGRGGFAGQGKKRGASFSRGEAQQDSTPISARSVYFNGLPAGVTESDVRAECTKYAPVRNVKLTNGNALVLFTTQEDAQKVGNSAVVGGVHATLLQKQTPAAQAPATQPWKPTEPNKPSANAMPNLSIFGAGTTSFFSFGASPQKESGAALNGGNHENKENAGDRTKPSEGLFGIPKGFGFGVPAKSMPQETPSKQQKKETTHPLFGVENNVFGGSGTATALEKPATMTQFSSQKRDLKGPTLGASNLSVFGSVAEADKKAEGVGSVFSFGAKTQVTQNEPAQVAQQRPTQKQTKFPTPFGQQHATAEMLNGKESRLERFSEQDEEQLQRRIDVLTAERENELDLMMKSGPSNGKGTSAGHKSHGIKGLCQDMCPELERLKRVKKREIEVFEMGPDGTPDQNLMVKRYHRNNTVFPASELRPEPVLKKTLTHLLDYVLPRSKDFYVTYTYIRDRMRSLRQDMICQSICSNVSIEILECNARFHIISYQKCCCQPGFDFKQNTENLTQCITTLNDQYKHFRAIGQPCVHEAEFYAYRLIHDPKPSDVLQEIPQYLFSRPAIQFALKVVGAIAENNFWRFFELTRLAPFRMASLLLTRFTEVRRAGLAHLRTARVSLPLTDVVKFFGFQDTTDARDTLIALGYSVDPNGNVDTLKYEPKDAPPSLADNQRLVGSKEGNRSLKDLITQGDGTFNSKFDQVPPCPPLNLYLASKPTQVKQESAQVDSNASDAKESRTTDTEPEPSVETEKTAPELNIFSGNNVFAKEQESVPKEPFGQTKVAPPESQTVSFGTNAQPFSFTNSIFGTQPKTSFDPQPKQEETSKAQPFTFAKTNIFEFSQPQVSTTTTTNNEKQAKDSVAMQQTTEKENVEKQEEKLDNLTEQPQQCFLFHFGSNQQTCVETDGKQQKPDKQQKLNAEADSQKQVFSLQEAPQNTSIEQHDYDLAPSQNTSIDAENTSIDFSSLVKEECSTPLCSRSNKDKNSQLHTEASISPVPFQMHQEEKVESAEQNIEEQKEMVDEFEGDVCDGDVEQCKIEEQDFWNYDEQKVEDEILAQLSDFCQCGFLAPGQLWTLGIQSTERDVFTQVLERKLSRCIFQSDSSAFKVKFFGNCGCRDDMCGTAKPQELCTIQSMLFYISPKSKSGWEQAFKTDLDALKKHGIGGGLVFVLFGCEPDDIMIQQTQEIFGADTGFEVLDEIRLQQLIEQHDDMEINSFIDDMLSDIFSQMSQLAPALPEWTEINVQEYAMEMINNLLRNKEVNWTSPDVYVKLFNATISAIIDELCPDDECSMKQRTTFHSLECFVNEEQQKQEEKQIEHLRTQLRESRLPFIKAGQSKVHHKNLVKAFGLFMEKLQKACNSSTNLEALSSALALGDHIQQLLSRHFIEFDNTSDERLKTVLPAIFYEVFQWRIRASVPFETAYFVRGIEKEELQERVEKDLQVFLKEAESRTKNRSKKALARKRPSTPASWDDETFSPALKRSYGTSLGTPSREAAANQRLAALLLTQVRTQKKQWAHSLF